MENTAPLVSVIVPVFNLERYVVEAVASVQAQAHQRVEIIIVDDGSTDATPTLIANVAISDSRVQVISQTNAGPSAARNEGLRRATGEFISFLDADDTLHPMKILRQLATLERTGAGIAFCDYYTTDEDLVPRTISPTRPQLSSINEQLPLQNVFPPHAALVRRDVVERVGLFDESLRSAEDWDYWIRCAAVTSMVHVTGALCSYRRHGGQSHNDRTRMRSSQLRVVRKHYRLGSHERRMAMAGFHWGEAKYQYGQEHFLRTFVELLKVVSRTRTPRHTLRVMRLAEYG
jgi:glycosyltransferase involved in cell wall biosynthesis